MSAGTTMLDELGIDGITEADVAVARQINARRNASRLTDYRLALRKRLEIKIEKNKPPLSQLPGGGYKKYRLIAGQHHRRDLKDIAEARKQTEEQRAEKGNAFPSIDPPVHVFYPNDIVIPETDGEALAMDQDQNKFREIGTAEEEGSMDAVIAENNRLKAQLAQMEHDKAETTGKAGKGK